MIAEMLWLGALLGQVPPPPPSPAAPAEAVRDTTPSAIWQGLALYDHVRVSGGTAGEWHTLTAGVQRRTASGSLALYGVHTERFSLRDQALVVDAYRSLWRDAYGNLRLQAAPDAQVLPRFDARAELFQGLGHGWEGWAAYRRQQFPVADVDVVGLGAGYFVGSWYLRERTLVASVADGWSPFVSVSARRYFGDGTDNSLTLSAGLGEEVLEIAPPAQGGAVDVITSGSRSLALSAQRFFTPSLGALLSVSYSAYSQIPNRVGLTLGLTSRW